MGFLPFCSVSLLSSSAVRVPLNNSSQQDSHICRWDRLSLWDFRSARTVPEQLGNLFRKHSDLTVNWTIYKSPRYCWWSSCSYGRDGYWSHDDQNAAHINIKLASLVRLRGQKCGSDSCELQRDWTYFLPILSPTGKKKTEQQGLIMFVRRNI